MKKLFSFFILTILNVICFAQDFDAYGIEHNEGLRKILPKIDNSVSTINAFDVTVGIINSTFSKPVTHYRFNDYSDPILMLNELLSKGDISNDLYALVKKDLDNTVNMENSTSIDSYVQQVKSELSNSLLHSIDQSKYLEFLSTLKHSSYFWDVSGENGRQYLNISSSPSKGGPSSQFYMSNDANFMKFNWWKVLGCDCVGAIVSLGNPLGAAGASVCSIIGQS